MSCIISLETWQRGLFDCELKLDRMGHIKNSKTSKTHAPVFIIGVPEKFLGF